MPKTGTVTPQAVKAAANDGEAVVCDLYVSGAEQGERVSGGFRFDCITNIDHHAPHPSMYRWISSGNLAVEYVAANGPAPEHVPVMMNHCDCDSIVSCGIARGILPPEKLYEEAVIAADHTGAQNDIADLLQPLQRKRDPELSYSCLKMLVEGMPMPKKAVEARDSYVRDREEAAELVDSGGLREVSPGFYGGIMPRRIDASFFPALVPEAMLIAVAIPRGSAWEVKIRLGRSAPEGFNLFSLDINSFDPNFGGRWNAGSNNRQKARWPFTNLEPELYMDALAQRMNQALTKV